VVRLNAHSALVIEIYRFEEVFNCSHDIPLPFYFLKWPYIQTFYHFTSYLKCCSFFFFYFPFWFIILFLYGSHLIMSRATSVDTPDLNWYDLKCACTCAVFFYHYFKTCNFYNLQVRFHVLSTVIRVATKAGNNWVKLYRLAYSEDCKKFNNLLDGAGNNIVISMCISCSS